MSEDKPKLAANFKNRVQTEKPKTLLSEFEDVVGQYKNLISDKVHPKNRTASYDKNTMSILNRLLVAADNLDAEKPGDGIFGLIVLGLRVNLALKDHNTELETQVRDLELRIKRLEKR